MIKTAYPELDEAINSSGIPCRQIYPDTGHIQIIPLIFKTWVPEDAEKLKSIVKKQKYDNRKWDVTNEIVFPNYSVKRRKWNRGFRIFSYGG